MANEVTISVVGTAAGALVEKEALDAFYSSRVVAREGVVLYKVVSEGQYYDFHVMGALTVGAINADGTIPSNTAWVHTQARVTMDDWRGVNIRVPIRATAQSAFDYDKLFARQGAEALGEDMDNQLLSLFASFTSPAAVGSSTSPDAFSDSTIRGAIARLDNGKVPQKKRHAILHPTAHMQLLADSDFKRADAVGKSEGVHVSGIVLPLYGITLLKTPIVNTSSSAYANMLIHEHAFGVVLNQDVKLAKHAQLGDYSEAHLASYLGGFNVTRAGSGVVMYSTTTT